MPTPDQNTIAHRAPYTWFLLTYGILVGEQAYTIGMLESARKCRLGVYGPPRMICHLDVPIWTNLAGIQIRTQIYCVVYRPKPSYYTVRGLQLWGTRMWGTRTAPVLYM